MNRTCALLLALVLPFLTHAESIRVATVNAHRLISPIGPHSAELDDDDRDKQKDYPTKLGNLCAMVKDCEIVCWQGVGGSMEGSVPCVVKIG